jgi:tRNA1Val (adenine37-N6)-methyltransferase
MSLLQFNGHFKKSTESYTIVTKDRGIMDEETVDEILDGSLKICQSRRGYRFNLDSLVLAHFASLKSRSVNMDLGCGNGVIALVLAKRYPSTRWTGLEIQEGPASLSRKNVEFNGLEKRVSVVLGDAREVKRNFAANSFDNVIFNPPYRKLSSGRINPLLEKAVARHEIKGSLADFLAASKYLLKPSGLVFTIYPAKRLVELVVLFRKNNIEPKRMKLVFSDAASDAEFVLVEGRSGSREELKMEPPLFIYEEPRKYTEDMKNIFSDLALLPAFSGG